MRPAQPFVSVILPCRNDRDLVGPCLESVLGSTYPPDRVEVLVVDGMSDDGTRGVLAHFASRDRRVRVLDNPMRTPAVALNLAIGSARGDVIVRMAVQNQYPSSYIGDVVQWLERSGADYVGGSWQTEPGRNSALARAIARGQSHPFGVGSGRARERSSEPRWVDAVPFGGYRRDVFDRIGLFDPELESNQDDELNARLVRSGGSILLVPHVVVRHRARASLRKLWSAYFQYGYFRPLALRKLGAVGTLRHLIPGLFVLTLISGLLLAPWSRLGRLVLRAAGGSYLVAVVGAAAATARRDPSASPFLVLVFPVLHLSYGAGFLLGVSEVVLLSRRTTGDPVAVPFSR